MPSRKTCCTDGRRARATQLSAVSTMCDYGVKQQNGGDFGAPEFCFLRSHTSDMRKKICGIEESGSKVADPVIALHLVHTVHVAVVTCLDACLDFFPRNSYSAFAASWRVPRGWSVRGARVTHWATYSARLSGAMPARGEERLSAHGGVFPLVFHGVFSILCSVQGRSGRVEPEKTLRQ